MLVVQPGDDLCVLFLGHRNILLWSSVADARRVCNRRPLARAGVQAEAPASRGPACRARRDRRWAEAGPKRAGGGAPSPPPPEGRPRLETLRARMSGAHDDGDYKETARRRVSGSGAERPAAEPKSLGACPKGRARGSGESRGTERDCRTFPVSGEAGRESGRRRPPAQASRLTWRLLTGFPIRSITSQLDTMVDTGRPVFLRPRGRRLARQGVRPCPTLPRA